MPAYNLTWDAFCSIIRKVIDKHDDSPLGQEIIEETCATPGDLVKIMRQSCPDDCDLMITSEAICILGSYTWLQLFESLTGGLDEYNEQVKLDEQIRNN